MEAWEECEQLRKAIVKNNAMKKNIAKRLRLNEKEAEKFREELGMLVVLLIILQKYVRIVIIS
ncbi:hypothetical protein EON65_58205 [archaeon]|nr:MAG: hypothetical protein EON65_58205 [archaeon]